MFVFVVVVFCVFFCVFFKLHLVESFEKIIILYKKARRGLGDRRREVYFVEKMHDGPSEGTLRVLFPNLRVWEGLGRGLGRGLRGFTMDQ